MHRNMKAKSLFFLLLTVAASSLAQQKCCFPDQFEILQGVLTGEVREGQGFVVPEHVQMAFDYTNRRRAFLDNVVYSDETEKTRFIWDYKKGVVYTIDDFLQTCVKGMLEGPMAHCVPEKATYVGSFYVGDNKMSVDTYSYLLTGPEIAVNVTLSVSKGDCLPYSTLVVGTEGNVPGLQVGQYFNYTNGIKDPSKYFTVPSYCNTTVKEAPVKMYKSSLYKILP